MTVPLFSDLEIENYRDRILLYLKDEAPEFQDNLPDSHWFSLTGFGALGIPSSFHNETVREIRLFAYNKLLPYMQLYAQQVGGEYFDQYIDRLMIRQGRFPGQRPQTASAESWHRDESVDEFGNPMPDSDTIFGGWINLNSFSEFFLGAPGTHFKTRNRGTGFGVISDTGKKQALERKLQKIEIKPGELFVFYENMAHKVVSASPPANTTQMRLFTGFRLTNDPRPVYGDLEDRLRRMDVIPLKSGQIPPLYAKLSWTNHAESMEIWTKETLIPELTERRTMGPATKMAGREFVIPKGGHISQPLPSMRTGQMPYEPREWIGVKYSGLLITTFSFGFPQYTERELEMYRPRRLDAPPIPEITLSKKLPCAVCENNTRYACQACSHVYCSNQCLKVGHNFLA